MTGTDFLPGQASLPTPNSTKSFWHREPSENLLGHRTTASLPTEADVVIVGSGISGSSAAHCLGQDTAGKKLKVVMLEAREACWGATGRNGGHCQPMVYSAPPDIGRFEMRNYLAIQDLIRANNVPCEWKALSVAHAYMDENMFNIMLAEFEALQDLEPALADLVTVVTPASTSPSLMDLRLPNAKGAFIQKHAASVWPYKLVSWMLETLLANNTYKKPDFNLQTTTPVTRLQKADNGSWIVHTDRGMIATKKILLTTNAYTSHLLPAFRDLIVPVRGEMSSLIPPASMHPGSENPPLTYSYGFLGHGKQNINQDDYLIQRPYIPDSRSQGGELMFGGGRSYAKAQGVGVSDDSSIDLPAAAYLRREISSVLDIQSREELKATFEWSGIMGFSKDNRPWVGELKEEFGLGGGEGLFMCAGFTGHGMPNTHLCAKAAVEMMLGKRKEDVDLPDVYHLSRERVERAEALEEVSVADAKGLH